MRTYKAIVRYRGGAFSGWQVQPGQRTVQGVIEEALGRIAGEAVRIVAAGRTDAGVHALGQVFSFSWAHETGPERLIRSLSKMLGPEIRIESVEAVAEGFNARRDATGKTYAYAFCDAKHPDPFSDEFAWTLPYEIDRRQVLDIAQELVGTHDFAGFCSSGSSVQTTVRTIHAIALVEGAVAGPAGDSGHWHLTFSGEGFLYKMIRNITGTLVDVARGKLAAAAIEERLHAPMPYHGFTAPPRGLFLVEVRYP